MNQAAAVISTDEDSTTYKTIATKSTTKIELERAITTLRRLSVDDNCTSVADSSLADVALDGLTNSSSDEVVDNNNMLGMNFTTSRQQLLIDGGVEAANTNAAILNRPSVGLVPREEVVSMSEERRRGVDPPPTELLVVYSDHGPEQQQQQRQDNDNRKEEAMEAYKKI